MVNRSLAKDDAIVALSEMGRNIFFLVHPLNISITRAHHLHSVRRSVPVCVSEIVVVFRLFFSFRLLSVQFLRRPLLVIWPTDHGISISATLNSGTAEPGCGYRVPNCVLRATGRTHPDCPDAHRHDGLLVRGTGGNGSGSLAAGRLW